MLLPCSLEQGTKSFLFFGALAQSSLLLCIEFYPSALTFAARKAGDLQSKI
jgi:hypothetical protein